MLAYEAIWIVLVPIQVTELIFPAPECRDEPWLRKRGLAVSSVVFLVGSVVAWFLWTQNARPNVFHVPVYHPPTLDGAPRRSGDRAPGGRRLRGAGAGAGPLGADASSTVGGRARGDGPSS
jgi:hypothetical protein